MLLREKDIFSIKDVEYAVLEPHGRISVLKKPEKQVAAKEDVNVKTAPLQYMPTEIIVDGSVVVQNLRDLNLSNEWLEKRSAKPEAQSLIFNKYFMRNCKAMARFILIKK